MSAESQVLIVEDNPDAAQLLELQLSELEVKTRLAHDGQQAILAVGPRRPDLIIMDLMMPELDGIEASRYFKKKYDDVGIPIMVVTAKKDPDSLSEVASVGCDDIFYKPYECDDFLASVRRLCALGRLQQEYHELKNRGLEGKKGRFWQRRRRKLEEEERQRQLDELAQRVCEAHIEAAENLIERGMGELVAYHLARIDRTCPDHPSIASIRATLDTEVP